MNPDVLKALISSLILVVCILFLRIILVRAVLRLEHQIAEVRRRWIVNIRNASIFILMLGLIFIWAEELRTLAFSFVAVAAALVLAVKELLLCFSGAFLRAGSNCFSVGDRIQIGGQRGDVIDQNMLTTKLMEIGPGQTSHQYTGRSIVIPNSLLLSNSLINESFTEEYGLHVISIPFNLSDDWQRAEQILLEAAAAECGPFLSAARASMKRLEKVGLDSPTVEPRVTLHIPEPGKINLLLRVPTPERRRGRLEQAILRRFLREFSQPAQLKESLRAF